MTNTQNIQYPTCPYCVSPLTDNEFDFESNGFYSAHQACVQPALDGAFAVITRQHAVTPMHETITTYTTHRRAVEVAEDTRRWNRRDQPCGAQLDIVVAARLGGVDLRTEV